MSTLPGRLNPITTGRLAGGLLASARPLSGGINDWRQGITFTSLCSSGHGVSHCVDPEDAVEKDINGVSEALTFDPFIVYNGVTCSTYSTTEELLDLARRGLESTISGTYARELQGDALDSQTNPTLNSEATDITPAGGPSDLTSTLSGLVSASVECGMADLVFHANVRILPYLLRDNLVEWSEAEQIWKVGPWAFSLDDYQPTGPGGFVPAEDGSEAWVYVTGPIEVAFGAEIDIDGVDVLENERVVLAERLGILRFDTCCVQAALACLGASSC